jgi:hypothetical protein
MEDTEKHDQQAWDYDADLKSIFNDALISTMDIVA